MSTTNFMQIRAPVQDLWWYTHHTCYTHKRKIKHFATMQQEYNKNYIDHRNNNTTFRKIIELKQKPLFVLSIMIKFGTHTYQSRKCAVFFQYSYVLSLVLSSRKPRYLQTSRFQLKTKLLKYLDLVILPSSWPNYFSNCHNLHDKIILFTFCLI